MTNYSYSIAWSEEDAGYVCTSPEFPGISAFGESAEDAVKEMQDAVSGAVETYRAAGRTLPAPSMRSTFSGQFRLRVPKALHASLVERASTEGVSLNALVSCSLARMIGETSSTQSFVDRIVPVVERLEASVERAESLGGALSDTVYKSGEWLEGFIQATWASPRRTWTPSTSRLEGSSSERGRPASERQGLAA